MYKVSNFYKLTVIVSILCSILLTGCASKETPGLESLVLKVDDSEVTLDEMMYHVILEELQGQLFSTYMGNGESYWDVVGENGVTMREEAKNMAMENAIKYEIFYNLALDRDYTLTEEEKEISKAKALDIRKNIPTDKLDEYGLTEEKLIEIQEKLALSTKYYEAYLIDLGVSEESIKDKINPADYQRYDIEYLYAQLKEYDQLSALKDAASTAKSLTELSENTDLNAGSLTFLEGAGTFGEEDNLEEVIKTMKSGETSDIIETVKGYYIIRLIDNTSTKEYDKAVRQAIEKAREEAFEPAYKQLKKEHKITINKKIWKRIVIGSNLY